MLYLNGFANAEALIIQLFSVAPSNSTPASALLLRRCFNPCLALLTTKLLSIVVNTQSGENKFQLSTRSWAELMRDSGWRTRAVCENVVDCCKLGEMQ